MTTINLKDFYYWYTQDQFIEVSDEVAEVFVSDARHPDPSSGSRGRYHPPCTWFRYVHPWTDTDL